ncbi:hypothetical protein BRADI_1g45884v3, partial [Brachypodium distachyon]
VCPTGEPDPRRRAPLRLSSSSLLLLRVFFLLSPAPLPISSTGVAGWSGIGRGGRSPLLYTCRVLVALEAGGAMPLSPSKSPASPGQIRRPLPRSTLPAASLGAPVAKLVLGGWSPGICSANNPVALPDLQGLKSPPSSFGCHGGGRREESGSCCGLCRYGSPHFFLFPWFACSHIPAWLPAADALFILRQRCAFLLVSFRSVQKSVEGLAEEIPIPSSTSPSGGPHRGSWDGFGRFVLLQYRRLSGVKTSSPLFGISSARD